MSDLAFEQSIKVLVEIEKRVDVNALRFEGPFGSFRYWPLVRIHLGSWLPHYLSKLPVPPEPT